MDCFIQEWDASIRDNRVVTLYKTVKDTFEYELYLDVIKDKYLCHALTKLRVSSHKLRIETGRYGRNRIERHERLCELCTSGQVEDEYHFLFECSCYRQLRLQYIPVFFTTRPNMYKLTLLFRSKNETVLYQSLYFMLCVYAQHCLINMFFILSFCMDTFLFLVFVLHRSTN